MDNLRILLIIEQCNPDWASVPLVGYHFYQEISQLTHTTLVTHQRNQSALQTKHPERDIIYIPESGWIPSYYQLINWLTSIGRKNWPLYHTLSYPIYEDFNQKVYQKFKDLVISNNYDLVHVITPMMPRYPVKLIKACQNTPFILGPVNGGVPFPSGFQKIANQEFAFLNFFRKIGKALIPGYTETYRKANKVLVGSTYTLNFIRDNFNLTSKQAELFYENGIEASFVNPQKAKGNQDTDIVKLLFVGRLVPYKGADMLIESVSKLSLKVKEKIQLTIVGDGSEKQSLERLVKERKLESIVNFTGWVKQQDTLSYYQQSDLFCFPSIREFGGAVVLEAMANKLPCLVVDNGGIGEYVTAETGVKIEPKSRSYVIEEMAKQIEVLVTNPSLRQQLSEKSLERVKDFEWPAKAQKIYDIYKEVLSN